MTKRAHTFLGLVLTISLAATATGCGSDDQVGRSSGSASSETTEPTFRSADSSKIGAQRSRTRAL